MLRSVKNNFIKHVCRKETSSKLPHKGYIWHGTNTGMQWHFTMKNYINKIKNSSDYKNNDENIAKGVIDTVNDIFPNFEFLMSEFALFGYMTQSDISFWSGIADAIGLYEDNYVMEGS